MLLGVRKERQSIPGTGRTDRRTTAGTAGSASYLQTTQGGRLDVGGVEG